MTVPPLIAGATAACPRGLRPCSRLRPPKRLSKVFKITPFKVEQERIGIQSRVGTPMPPRPIHKGSLLEAHNKSSGLKIKGSRVMYCNIISSKTGTT